MLKLCCLSDLEIAVVIAPPEYSGAVKRVLQTRCFYVVLSGGRCYQAQNVKLATGILRDLASFISRACILQAFLESSLRIIKITFWFVIGKRYWHFWNDCNLRDCNRGI